jgi:hypothetical protein
MLYFFTGSDTDTLREKLRATIEKAAKSAQGRSASGGKIQNTVFRVTDAHVLPDLDAALRGAGLFGAERNVVLENILQNETLREPLLTALPHIAKSDELFFMLESGLDAETRKRVEKYAEKTERADAPKKAKDNSIFAVANALQRGPKKDLWVLYQRELMKGSAPEAIHGTLFWAAKQAFLRSDTPKNRGLVARLAELPHEARRRGFDLEYALELFVLSPR